MLVIVDMQNRILDTDDENYVLGADKIIPKILQRLTKARKSGEMVLLREIFPSSIRMNPKNESNYR